MWLDGRVVGQTNLRDGMATQGIHACLSIHEASQAKVRLGGGKIRWWIAARLTSELAEREPCAMWIFEFRSGSRCQFSRSR